MVTLLYVVIVIVYMYCEYCTVEQLTIDIKEDCFFIRHSTLYRRSGWCSWMLFSLLTVKKMMLLKTIDLFLRCVVDLIASSSFPRGGKHQLRPQKLYLTARPQEHSYLTSRPQVHGSFNCATTGAFLFNIAIKDPSSRTCVNRNASQKIMYVRHFKYVLQVVFLLETLISLVPQPCCHPVWYSTSSCIVASVIFYCTVCVYLRYLVDSVYSSLATPMLVLGKSAASMAIAY
jgi:hypothetical protein